MLFCYNCQVFTYYALSKQKNRQEKNYFSKAQGGHTLVGDIVRISPESHPPPPSPPHPVIADNFVPILTKFAKF